MSSAPNYRLLLRCCYLGMFIQALVINLTPLLFVPLREQFGLTFEQVGRLVLINFSTQLVVDLICCALADRVNPKPLLVLANILSAVGLWIFAFAPTLFAFPYEGLIWGTVIFSIGCGLLEVLLSPIINAIPSDRKGADMALLHAFYPIGKVTVIVVTAIALAVFGIEHWPKIMVAWSIFPILNIFGFSFVDIPPLSEEGRRQTLRSLAPQPSFIFLVLTMVLAGATEVTLAQWASTFAQVGLGYSKFAADLIGFGLFSAGMIVGRLWFGIYGANINLGKALIVGAGLSLLVCLIMALSPLPWLALAACSAAGLFVSMLWPGTLSLCAARFPLAGASMFALLAAAGDSGAAVFPWIMGWVADQTGTALPFLLDLFQSLSTEQLGLRVGILVTGLCPILLAIAVWLERRTKPSPTKECRFDDRH